MFCGDVRFDTGWKKVFGCEVFVAVGHGCSGWVAFYGQEDRPRMRFEYQQVCASASLGKRSEGRRDAWPCVGPDASVQDALGRGLIIGLR